MVALRVPGHVVGVLKGRDTRRPDPVSNTSSSGGVRLTMRSRWPALIERHREISLPLNVPVCQLLPHVAVDLNDLVCLRNIDENLAPAGLERESFRMTRECVPGFADDALGLNSAAETSMFDRLSTCARARELERSRRVPVRTTTNCNTH
jgi:hypothetical protein